MTINTQQRPIGGSAARLALLRSPGVRVTLLIAPAGYGKTTLANALRKEHANSASCNCESASLSEFARNVLAALAVENPAESSVYSGFQAQLAATVDNENECKNLLNAAWSRNPPPSLFVFENAEAVAGKSPIVGALIGLLNTAPPNRKIIVCSRAPLPARASRYLPPHRISTISTMQLALSHAEATELLEQQAVEPRYWETIIRVARGWPVVLLLLARLAWEGRLQAALADAHRVEFEDLFVYLLHDVIDPLDASVKRVITLCAAVPGLSLHEIAVATDATALQVEATLRKALLVERDENGFTVHPLLREVLLQSQPDTRPYILRIAAFAREAGNMWRAALLYRLVGDHDAAAECLAPLSFQALEDAHAADQLLQLDLQSLRKYPKLLAACAQHRSDVTIDILREAFDALGQEDDPEAIVAVAEMYSDRLQDPTQALAVVNSAIVAQAARASTPAATLLTGWPETLLVQFNVLYGPNTIERLSDAYDVLLRARLPFHSARAAQALAGATRRQGKRAESLHWGAVAADHARNSGPRVHAGWLFHSIYNAWLWGDETAFKEFYEELETCASSTQHPDYAWVLRALQPETLDSALPLWDNGISVGALLMAASKVPMPDRLDLLNRADAVFATMGASGNFTLLARAASDPNRRRELCAQEAAMPHLAEWPERRAAVLAYGEGRPSYLDSYTAHFEPKSTEALQSAASANTPRLELLQERVTIGSTPVKLTPREASLLTFLSRRRIATPREEIQDAIWPELDEAGARDALYSLLHRLRKRTMRVDIVEGVGNAYRLAEGVQVDLWDLEFIAQQLQRAAGVDSSVDLAELYSRVQQREYPHLRDYEWFAPIEFRVHESARVIARHLVGEAKAAGDDAAVLRYVTDLIEEDACDEWAHATLIRLHLEKQNRAEAGRAYRTYCQLLEQQIGAPPSAEMQQLAQNLSV